MKKLGANPSSPRELFLGDADNASLNTFSVNKSMILSFMGLVKFRSRVKHTCSLDQCDVHLDLI